jgi:hypothetical protein
MNIENRNIRTFNIITVIVLTAILLTTLGGFIIQRQNPPVKNNSMGMNGIGSGSNPMRPESAQTGPTGKLLLTTGIRLLLAGFGILVVILMVLIGNNLLRPAIS